MPSTFTWDEAVEPEKFSFEDATAPLDSEREAKGISLRAQRDAIAADDKNLWNVAWRASDFLTGAGEAAKRLPAQVLNAPAALNNALLPENLRSPLPFEPGKPIVPPEVFMPSLRADAPRYANPPAAEQVTQGLAEAGANFASGLTTPENLVAMPLLKTPIAPAIGAGFATQAAAGVPESAQRFGTAVGTQGVPLSEKVKAGAELGINMALPAVIGAGPEVAGRLAADRADEALFQRSSDAQALRKATEASIPKRFTFDEAKLEPLPPESAATALNPPLEPMTQAEAAAKPAEAVAPRAHLAEPPPELRKVLDEEGVIYGGAYEPVELGDGTKTKGLHSVEVYDPNDPTAHTAGLNFPFGTPIEEIRSRIAAKRAEFGWEKPTFEETKPADQPQAQAGKEPSASSITSPAEVHGNLRTRAGEGPGQVPVEEGGPGVRANAPEGTAAEKGKAGPENVLPPEVAEPDLAQIKARSDTFERARNGDEKAFDDLDAQFRNIHPEPEDLAYRGQPNPNQVFTKEQFASKFNAAFASHEFYKVLDIIKATSDVSIWKPFLQDLFKKQAKDPVAAEKAEWMRHVFNGTEPKNVVPRPAPRPAGTQRPPPPVTPNPRPKAGQPPPPRPPVTPPSPPPVRIPVEPIPGGGAKSPFKIIEDFSEAIGKAIRVRRLKANTLGTYSPGSTLTAEKFAGDLDTAAHELAGHWMDDRYGIGAPWAKSKTRSPYDTELAKFWIHGSVTPRSTLRYRRAEGVAEYIRAYVVNPKMAKAEAPNFTAYFEKTVTPEGLKAILDFSNDVRIWAGEDPLVRAGLNMRMEPPSLRERLWEGMRGRGFGFEINPIDRLRMWFDDPYHYAVKAFKEANALRGGQLLPKDNFELQARLLSTHDARMSDEFEHGLTPLRPAQAVNSRGQLEVQRLIDPVTKQPMTMNWLLDAFDKTSKDKFNQDMRDASAYMVAQRTVEKGKQLGRESNISGIGAGILTDKAAAEELLRRVAADPVRETRLKEAARRYRLWADQNLNMLVDSGRLSKDAAREIRNNNEQYVDMHRLSMEFEEGNRAQRGGKIGTTRDVIRRFKGSTLELDNVYSNLLEQTDSIQKEAFRNVTLNTFVDSLRNVRELHGANLKDFEQFGSKASSADRNTITVWKNGKPEYWKFDPDIHDSLKGLGELGTHAFIDLLSMPSQFARYMITHGPQFLLRNPMRDTFERSVVSRNGSKPWDILRGYTPEELSRYEVFGGGQFGNYIVDRHVWNRELKKSAAELRKDPTNILLSPLKLKHAWEDLSEKSEKIGRIAEFRRAFEMGKKEFGYDDYNAALYAAGEARGLMDFAKAGTVMRVINRLVPFSNARVRGLARSAFSIGENPAGFAMRWGMFVLVPTILNAIYQRQNKDTWDEYQQLPAYQRDFFWNFKVGPYWLRIPRPHELGVMAGGVERAIDRLLGDRRAMEGWAGSAANAVLPINTPVEGTGPLKTFLELQFNRDTFRGRDIVPAWEKDLKVELRKGTAHSSAVSKGIASALKVAGLEIDPRNLDYLLGSLGGAGQTAAMISTPHRSLVDTALKTTGYIAESSGAASRDVQWVTDWAKQNGKLGTKDFQTLRDARKLVMDATDAVDRDNKSRSLRHLGTAMRDKIEHP
jgi:hypothetical protein